MSEVDWLERIRALPADAPGRVLNVCGGHERTITMAGLRDVLPEHVQIIPGPGCPVCVCPEEDVYLAIQLAMAGHVVASFGDMLRVPANAPRGQPRSLEQARAAGADVVPVAAPQQAFALARENPDRTVVFFAAGFETTMAPVAASIRHGVPDNLELLISGRLTWPAVKLLLESGNVGFDALVAPGHVATVMGPEEWRFVVEDHGLPTAVAGFTPEAFLEALYDVLAQLATGRSELHNRYGTTVRAGGNPTARAVLGEVFEISDVPWRGIGTLPGSGFTLAAAYAAHDARRNHPELADDARRLAGAMPPGCRCADVVLGRTPPTGCPLYGRTCTPANPVGPCMVSDEGACRIWWAGGRRAA